MSYEQIFTDTIQEGYIKRIADDILQGITKVREKKELSSKRWLWELLQNAKDVPSRWEKGVTIRIELNKDKVKFQHNGEPFTAKNLINLIQQVSSKDNPEEDDITGKFGTGFLVTHILSSRLELMSILHDKNNPHYKFNLTIDRSAEKSQNLIKNIKDLFHKVQNCETDDSFTKLSKYNPKESEFHTSFEYSLNDKSYEYAFNGINELINTLPLTLIFVKKIFKVIIDNKVNNKVYNFQREKKIDEKFYINTATGNRIFWVKDIAENNLQVALEVDENDNLIDWKKDTPRLFCDFPLVGSDNFYSPFVINSPNFNPNETRSGILINDLDSKLVEQNKRLLEQTFTLKKSFIQEFCESSNLSKSYLFAESRVPRELDSDAKQWYIEQIRNPYRQFLIDNLYYQNLDGTKSKLRKLKVPFTDVLKDEFYSICERLVPSVILPLQKEFKEWEKKLKPVDDSWGAELCLTIEYLLKYIEDRRTIKDLAIDLNTRKNVLNELYSFLMESNHINLLNDYNVIPNIDGKFCSFASLIKNKNISKKLIEIITELNPKYKLRIQHQNISLKIPNESAKNSLDVLKDIQDIVTHDAFGTTSIEKEILYKLLQIKTSDYDTIQDDFFIAYCEFFGLPKERYYMYDAELNFKSIITKSLKIILFDIQEKLSLEQLSKGLEYNDEDTHKWLLELLSNIKDSSTYRSILDNYKVYPNLYDELLNKSDLYKMELFEGNFPSEIIEYHTSIVKDGELKAKIINPLYSSLIDKIKTLDEIGNDITNHINIYNQNWDTLSVELKSDIIELLQWTSKNEVSKSLSEKYLKQLVELKPIIYMKRLEGAQEKEVIFNLMNSNDPIKIKMVGEYFDKLKSLDHEEFEEVIQLTNDIQSLSPKVRKRITDKIEDEKEKELDFKVKKNIGDSLETAFKGIFEGLNINWQIKKIEGMADFKIVIGNEEYYIELKSLAHKGNHNVKLAYSQAVGCISFPNKYALGVLIRPENWNMLINTAEANAYVLENLKFNVNLAPLIKDEFTLAKEFKRDLIDTPQRGISVEFDNDKFKFVLSPRVWNENLISFEDLILHILK